MKKVKAKKQLGQHFLTNLQIAQDTVDAFGRDSNFNRGIEIGPGMGVLTEALKKRTELDFKVVDIDEESITYLKENQIISNSQLIHGDFLKMDLKTIFGDEPFGIIGNFPYNISTQILFKLYDYRDQAVELVGMFQKEVAERVVSPPGSKVYGITSVLLQAFYDVEYLFTVDEHDFDPPPKVKSAVIRLKRNQTKALDCDEKKFKQTVKMAFNQRRKTLRNALKALINQKPEVKSDPIFDERAEQLSVKEFVHIVHLLD